MHPHTLSHIPSPPLTLTSHHPLTLSLHLPLPLPLPLTPTPPSSPPLPSPSPSLTSPHPHSSFLPLPLHAIFYRGGGREQQLLVPLPRHAQLLCGICSGDITTQHNTSTHLLTHPINTSIHTPHQHTRSTHPINIPYQHTLSTHLINTSIHTPHQHTPSTPHFTLYYNPLPPLSPYPLSTPPPPSPSINTPLTPYPYPLLSPYPLPLPPPLPGLQRCHRPHHQRRSLLRPRTRLLPLPLQHPLLPHHVPRRKRARATSGTAGGGGG